MRAIIYVFICVFCTFCGGFPGFGMGIAVCLLDYLPNKYYDNKMHKKHEEGRRLQEGGGWQPEDADEYKGMLS